MSDCAHEWIPNRMGRAYPHVKRAVICTKCSAIADPEGNITVEPSEESKARLLVQGCFEKAWLETFGVRP